MAEKTSSINCNESLDAFPASGLLQIEDEIIQYSGKTADGKSFWVQRRGYNNTERMAHPDNCEVHQLITNHTYLVGELPITSITDVKVDGFPAPVGTYSINLTGTYGKIIFNEKPYSYQYAKSSQVFELFAFETMPDNTAWQAVYCYDQNKTSSSALINEAYPKLSIKLLDNLSYDMGMVVTAYLTVHHWETNIYSHDHVDVYIDGIGKLGSLTRPSPDDILDLTADVDIDHPHGYQDPGLKTVDPTHPHGMSATKDAASNGSPFSWNPSGISGDAGGQFLGGGWQTINFYVNHTGTNATAFVSFNIESWGGGGGYVQYIQYKHALNGDPVTIDVSGFINKDLRISVAIGDWTSPQQNFWFQIRIAVYCWGGSGASVAARCTNFLLEYTPYVTATYNAATSINTGIDPLLPGNVDQLLIDNRDIEFVEQDTPSRTLIDRFDISDKVLPTWGWFKGRRVYLQYVSVTNEIVNVFIPWITFEIEYRAKERVFSNNITATVIGDTDKLPNQVIERLLDKAGVPASCIDAASFMSCATWYANPGRAYAIDGVINGDWEVNEAIKKVCRQTRSRMFWTAGLIKLAYRKTASQMVVGKWLGSTDYQAKSISVLRQSVADLVNSFELKYAVDRQASDEKYLGSIVKTDAASIAKHGKREKPDDFKFDLIRNGTMAADVAAYYISTLANPSSFYEFNTYLDKLDLEKEDVLALTSAGFHKMRKMPMRIKGINRIFGSGKNKAINHLRVVAECLRYVLIDVELPLAGSPDQNTVIVYDQLSAVIGKLIDLADHVHVEDDYSFAENAGLSEEQFIEDSVDFVWNALHTFDETVTVADSLGFGWNVFIEDSVKLLELLTLWRGIGFGSQDFGRFGFGGIKQWNETNPDEVLFVDELGSDIGSTFSEVVTVSDRLEASTGFGSPGTISSGFSHLPFGK